VSDPYTEEIKSNLKAAVAALNAGQLVNAEHLAGSVLRQIPGEPMAAQIMGTVRIQQKRYDEALGFVGAGLQHLPESAGLQNLAGGAYQGKGDHQKALECFQRASNAAPGNPLVFLNLGKTAFNLDLIDDARAAFEACLKLAPETAEALAGLARLSLLKGAAEKAFELADRSLSIEPDSATSQLTKAEAALAMGNAEMAFEVSKSLTARPRTRIQIRSLAYGVAAEAADKLKQYDEAFELFRAANDLTHEHTKSQMVPIVAHQSMDRLTALCGELPALASKSAAWPQKFEQPGPVFFMGFTRSGTTLLQQILTAHSKIVSAETEPLTHAWREVLHAPDIAHHIKNMTPDTVSEFRAKYFSQIGKLDAKVPERGVLLDWHPLYSQYLPVIARVFPDAKIIFAKRDPRDCVLSCFQQRFAMSRSAFHFLKLDTAAQFYDDVMSVAEATRDAFDLNIMDVRYEDLIGGVEPKTRELISFLGLDWEDGMLDYRDKAAEANIKTPSAAQVVKPLYDTAAGKWLNYEKQMAPARGLLDPWARKFGYDA